MYIQLIDTTTSLTPTFFELSCPIDNELHEVNIGEEDLYQRAYSQALTRASRR